ncbi:MAG: diguanylate cyclase domain-containing protein, partial [Thomasclavelia ramosa]
VVVWKNLNSETDLMNKINEILLEMKTEFSKGDKTNIISVSMGIVNSKGRDIDVDHLLLQGDLALYRAKEQGKNQFVIYTDDIEKERLFALELEMDLRDAIKNNEITLFYQPQYTCDKQLQGFEALFRWDIQNISTYPLLILLK